MSDTPINIGSYYSTETKVQRPKIVPAEAPQALPTQHLISDKEMSNKMTQINTDIYQGAKKERSKYEFNRGLYFKIFGGVTLLACGIAGYKKIKGFFKKS